VAPTAAAGDAGPAAPAASPAATKELRQLISVLGALHKRTIENTQAIQKLNGDIGKLGTAARRASGGVKDIGDKADDAKEKMGVLEAAGRAALSGNSWLVTAVGAAQARNYGYAVGAVAQKMIAMGKAAGAAGGMAAGAAIGVAAVAIAAVAAAAAAAAAIAGLAKSVAQYGTEGAVELENLRFQMNGLLPTAKQTDEELQYLFKLGNRSAVPTEGLIELDKKLIAAGVSATNMRRSLVESVAAFGTASSLSTEQMNSLNYLITEVANKGFVLRTDLRQLSSAGLSMGQLLQQAAKDSGISFAEMNARVSEGKFTSEQFMVAMTGYLGQFKGAAAEANSGVRNSMQNLKDTISSSMSQAFLNAGVTTAISSLINKIRGIVEQVQPAFTLIGQQVAYFFQVLGANVGSTADTVGGWVSKIFYELIPTAIQFATKFVFHIQRWMVALGPIFDWFGKLVSNAVGSAGDTAGKASPIFTGMAYAVASIATAGIFVYEVLRGVVQGIGNFMGAVVDFLSGNLDVGARMQGIADAGNTIAGAFGAAGHAAEGFAASIKQASDMKMPEYKPTGPPKLSDSGMSINPAGGEGGDGGGKGGGGKGGGGKGGGGGGGAWAREQANALNELWEALQRFMKQRSQFEKDFLGGAKGFTASTEQIYDAAKKYVDLVKKGTSGKTESYLVRYIKTQTLELIKLANKRDVVLKQIEAADKKLQDLLQKRNQLRDALTSNVRDLSSVINGGNSVADWQRLDTFGSFVEETGKNQPDFLQALKDRVAAAKQFQKDLQALKDKGVAASIIEQIAGAGLSGGAGAASQLAGLSAAVIAQINAQQAELEKVAAATGTLAGNAVFQTPIQSAQDLLDALKGKEADIAAAAAKIASTVRTELLKIATPAKQAGDSAGRNVASGIGTGFKTGLGSGFGGALRAGIVTPGNLTTASSTGGSLGNMTSQGVKNKLKAMSLSGALRDGIASPGNKNRAVEAGETLGKQVAKGIKAGMGQTITLRIGQGPQANKPLPVDFGSYAVPFLAAGGIVQRPTLAMVGEAGREAVLPLRSPSAMREIGDAISRNPAAGNIHVYIGDREITDMIRVEMRHSDRERGRRLTAGRA
jgi:hypothetical protein